MGYRGTTNCMLNYGDEDNCIGELLGEPGSGLATMFLMMNEVNNLLLISLLEPLIDILLSSLVVL